MAGCCKNIHCTPKTTLLGIIFKMVFLKEKLCTVNSFSFTKEKVNLFIFFFLVWTSAGA